MRQTLCVCVCVCYAANRLNIVMMSEIFLWLFSRQNFIIEKVIIVACRWLMVRSSPQDPNDTVGAPDCAAALNASQQSVVGCLISKAPSFAAKKCNLLFQFIRISQIVDRMRPQEHDGTVELTLGFS